LDDDRRMESAVVTPFVPPAQNPRTSVDFRGRKKTAVFQRLADISGLQRRWRSGRTRTRDPRRDRPVRTLASIREPKRAPHESSLYPLSIAFARGRFWRDGRKSVENRWRSARDWAAGTPPSQPTNSSRAPGHSQPRLCKRVTLDFMSPDMIGCVILFRDRISLDTNSPERWRASVTLRG
jgi:hypothetical protein